MRACLSDSIVDFPSVPPSCCIPAFLQPSHTSFVSVRGGGGGRGEKEGGLWCEYIVDNRSDIVLMTSFSRCVVVEKVGSCVRGEKGEGRRRDEDGIGDGDEEGWGWESRLALFLSGGGEGGMGRR